MNPSTFTESFEFICAAKVRRNKGFLIRRGELMLDV